MNTEMRTVHYNGEPLYFPHISINEGRKWSTLQVPATSKLASGVRDSLVLIDILQPNREETLYYLDPKKRLDGRLVAHTHPPEEKSLLLVYKKVCELSALIPERRVVCAFFNRWGIIVEVNSLGGEEVWATTTLHEGFQRAVVTEVGESGSLFRRLEIGSLIFHELTWSQGALINGEKAQTIPETVFDPVPTRDQWS